ncbi:hypothetical protein Thiofri_02395 [Thiorhodovibrio frisius]|nr:hypothetical protein [Thiorhodovibrio frisius]WPL22235.1 hypothetical protein Thiofri_02395 [Thiorhodovibrio frisius]
MLTFNFLPASPQEDNAKFAGGQSPLGDFRPGFGCACLTYSHFEFEVGSLRRIVDLLPCFGSKKLDLASFV